MVARFLTAASLLLAIAITPALCRLRPEACEATAVVVAVTAPPDVAPALADEDPLHALEAAAVMARRGQAERIARVEPRFPTRLLRAVASGQLDGHWRLAAAVLYRMGEDTRLAAAQLLREGSEAERDAARAALSLLDGVSPNSSEF